MKMNIQMFALSNEASWNEDEVNSLIRACATAATDLVSAIDSESKSLEDLDDNWYSDNAQNFGGQFVPSFQSFITNVNSYMNSAGQAIISAAQSYAAAGGGSYSGSWSEQNARAVNANFQLKDGGGRQGANPEAGPIFDSATTSGIADIKSALETFTSAVSSSLAFCNSNMSTLQGTVSRCNGQIASWQDDNTAAFNKVAREEIQAFVDTAQKVSTAFSGN